MGRVLTVSRVTVTVEFEAEYVRTVHELAGIAEERGQHLWLFRGGSPGQYLEFSESRTAMGHRARASRTDLEVRLERRLKEIAQYAPDAWELWEEVPKAPPRLSEEWGADEGHHGI